MVPSASTSSSRLMPTPLSEKAIVFASGSMAIWMRERFAGLDQFGLGDRLVAQLLAGVGGVRDELAHEDVAVRIDRMDHQVQEARDVGLETLGLGRRSAGGTATSVVKFASPIVKRAGANAAARRRRSYREEVLTISRRLGVTATGQKKGGSAGRGPADPPACVATSGPTRRSGAGGQKHRATASNRTIAARAVFCRSVAAPD